jgi:hypothetical protein
MCWARDWAQTCAVGPPRDRPMNALRACCRRGRGPTVPLRRGAAPARQQAQAPGGGATTGPRSVPTALTPQGYPTDAGAPRSGVPGTPTVGSAWRSPTGREARPGRQASRAGGASPALAVPVPRRGVRPFGARCPPRGGRRSGLSTALPALVLPPAPLVPNATLHLPPEAGARDARRLDAVRCSG